MNKNVNYGNWVPEKMLALCYVAAAVLGIAAYVTGPVLHLAIPTWILGILAAICLVYGIYMHICHELFAFGKGNMMAKVHQHLVDHLEWDGEGTLLDIGCGAAAGSQMQQIQYIQIHIRRNTVRFHQRGQKRQQHYSGQKDPQTDQAVISAIQ